MTRAAARSADSGSADSGSAVSGSADSGSTVTRYELSWATPAGVLVALEPRPDELEPHLAALTAAYNDPRNAPLLGHTAELSAADVREHYRSFDAAGARQFLLFVDGAIAGDADLRGLSGGSAEFAFLIADPAAQGRGLGTRFALMLHALAFGPLALTRVYASVVPANTASLRVFAKLGYTADTTPAARAYADDPGDTVLSLAPAAFAALHAATAAELRLAPR